jgi:hypothetical protein
MEHLVEFVEQLFAQKRRLFIPGLRPGIYPYVGGVGDAARLREVVGLCGAAVVSGPGGAKAARKTQGVLLDPAEYARKASEAREDLFDGYTWLERQRAADVPVMLTDARYIGARDRSALRQALRRWENIAEPTLAVLPIGTWWLRNDGLEWLIADVTAAGRPVAIVLMDVGDGLDAPGAVAGLMRLTLEVAAPVVLLRFSIAAVGIGAFAAFIGVSDATRHGPPPRRRRLNPSKVADVNRDKSPNVFVPALHDYFKASKLPSMARSHKDDLLRCYDTECVGKSLLRFAETVDTNLTETRAAAYWHNMASHEQIVRDIFASAEWQDAWWRRCKSGAEVAVSISRRGISLPLSGWLFQWLQLGSPSYQGASVR